MAYLGRSNAGFTLKMRRLNYHGTSSRLTSSPYNATPWRTDQVFDGPSFCHPSDQTRKAFQWEILWEIHVVHSCSWTILWLSILEQNSFCTIALRTHGNSLGMEHSLNLHVVEAPLCTAQGGEGRFKREQRNSRGWCLWMFDGRACSSMDRKVVGGSTMW